MTGEDDGEQCRNEGKQRKLDVPNPRVSLQSPEDHLKVDTSEPGREARGSHRTKSFQGLIMWVYTGAASWALPTGILTGLRVGPLAETDWS